MISLHTKKLFEYRIGVSTIFLVTSFMTVLISVRPLVTLLVLQMAQSTNYEADFILHPKQNFPISFNANTNPYNIDPFNRIGVSDLSSITMPKEEPQKLINSIFGINLLNTKALKRRIASMQEYAGVASRWMFFGNLMDPAKPENRVLSTISVIDSAQEIKIGLGRRFES